MRIPTTILTLLLFIGCNSIENKKVEKQEPNLLADREAPLGWVYLRTYPDSSFEFILTGLRDRTVYPGNYRIQEDTIFFDYTDSIPKLNSTKAIYRNGSIVYLDGTYYEVLKISKNDVFSETIIEKFGASKTIYPEYTSKVIPEKTNYNNFEVAYLDFHKDWLQRIFISIDTVNIYDTLLIQSIICEIQTLFDPDEKSSISFFSEKKYADYKTTLFIDENHLFPMEEYDNWMNYYYLAEYEFETNEYKTYPSCGKDYKRQKTIRIDCK
jgi:hypothetical protein